MRRWREAVQKLIELTRAGEITWQTSDDTVGFGGFQREGVFGVPYFARYLGKHLVLYEVRFKSHNDEGVAFWKHVAVLEFVTDGGILEWSWPVEDETGELLEIVRREKSRANEFFDDLISQEVPSRAKK